VDKLKFVLLINIFVNNVLDN